MLYNIKINKFLYYLLNLTWGLPLTAVGILCAIPLLIAGYRPKRHGGCFYFNVGEKWGGVNLGLIFITDSLDIPHAKDHEYGHSIQNAILGPFMLVLVAIPSAIRYWIFQLRKALNKPNPLYDSIWFERDATNFGSYTISQW